MAMNDDELYNDILREELKKQSAMPKDLSAAAQESPAMGTLPLPRNGNTGVTGAPVVTEARDGIAEKVESPAMDTSKWDTDGYGSPKYTAKDYGSAVAGFDQAKWADPNHQTPKYVVGRIMQEAAGGTGNLADPTARAAAIAKIQEAYPGATYNGKDKITMPDGGTVDVFTGASAGQYGLAWQPETGPGGAPLPSEGGGQAGVTPGGIGSSSGRINYLTQDSTADALQKKLMQILGGDQALDRDVLMRMLGA